MLQSIKNYLEHALENHFVKRVFQKYFNAIEVREQGGAENFSVKSPALSYLRELYE